MRIINSGSTKLNVALGRGSRTFKAWNWVGILVAVPLLLTAAFWVLAPQVGQAQGSVPAQPTGLTATAGNQQAALVWDDPADSSITGYEYLQAEAGKLIASDGAADDEAGISVAVDGETAVVGAFKDGPGSAYVYTRQSGVWSQVAKLTASDGTADDRFGSSVAVDGYTVVVGAQGDESDQGAAYVYTKPDTGWVTTSTAAKLTASDGDDGDTFGHSVAVEYDTLVVGAQGDDSHKGSAYVFTRPRSGWVSTSTAAKLTASDGEATDEFGKSVAVDYDTVVVGAHTDDHDEIFSGAAYVFTKPADGWATTSTAAKLTASPVYGLEAFGFSVAVDGDTIVVGAPQEGEDGNLDFSGAAYVFTKPADGWGATSTAAKLTASDGAAYDYFGISVALDGDTVVVGANYDDDDGTNSGAAYVFTKPASGWVTATETVKLTASDGAADDSFGISVAVDGDTVVVGAYGDDDKGSKSGSAYTYKVSDWTDIPSSGSGETNATSYTVTGLTTGLEYDIRIRATNSVGTGVASDVATVKLLGPPVKPTGLTGVGGDTQATLTWYDPSDSSITGYEYRRQRQVAKLTASDGASDDWFGWSMAMDGDTAVVGARTDDSTAGSAYVLTQQSGVWSQVAKLTASDGAAGEEFGESVSIDGETVVVGAPQHDGGKGVAYLFTKPGTGWADATETAKLTASDGSGGDEFGDSVAVDGDTVVVGAPLDDDNISNSGSAYVFTKPSGGWGDATQTAKLTASDGLLYSRFGSSVDVDGDTVMVGAATHDLARGAVYVFSKPGSGWADATEMAQLTASDADAGDQLGWSMELDGDTLVVGATFDDVNGEHSGSAYVFTEPVGGWTDATQTAKLTAFDGAANDQFGTSVAIDGDMVVVGAPLDDGVGLSSGSVYTFSKPSGGWATVARTATIKASDEAFGDRFGKSVAVDGETLLVGAPLDNDNGVSSGSAYVFEVSAWFDISDSAPGGTNATSHTVTGLTNDIGYGFRIRATNNLGTGVASEAVTVTPTS